MRLTLLLILLITCFSAKAEGLVRIAAAADLQPALAIIEEQFKQYYPNAQIAITYGASGTLTSQIRQGAPFQVFLSANEENADILIREGKTSGTGVIYALGRIAFISRLDIQADSAVEALKEWQEIKRPSDRLAIANPIHAPNGITAMSWLQHWDKAASVESTLVYGENASQSVQFVLSGAANSGIVAWPLIALRDDLSINTWLIPSEEHELASRKMVLIRNANQTAVNFYQFMQSDIAQNLLSQYGFGVP